MPTTIEDGFRRLQVRLTPSKTESQAAIRHRASIEDCLRKKLGLTNFFLSGSFGHGTSIRGYSDVDRFAVIPEKYLREDSLRSLLILKRVLANRFPNTGVRVNPPAVLVPFGSDKSESTEVVLAFFLDDSSKEFEIYIIPDGKKGWMLSSPGAHKKYLTDIDAMLKNKVKPLVRFIKAWKYYREVPISSFFLELAVADYANSENEIIYSFDLWKIFDFLLNARLPTIKDAMQISGNIDPCRTPNKRMVAIKKLKTAVSFAHKANVAEERGNIKLAFTYWKLLFKNRFPSYG